MRWTIRISYESGDSNQHYDTVDELGVSWENLDMAKRALDWIKQRTELEEARRDYRTRYSWEEYMEKLKALPCAPDDYHDVRMMVPLDDGTLHPISTFWIGYFERLHCAEIVPVSDRAEETGMKYTPR